MDVKLNDFYLNTPILVAYYRVITQITVQITRIVVFLVGKCLYHGTVLMFTVLHKFLLVR